MTWLSAESKRKIWAVYSSQGTAPGNEFIMCALAAGRTRKWCLWHVHHHSISSFLFLCPSQDGWGVLLERMRVISYCWTKKKLAVKFSSFLFLSCQMSSLLCPAHLHSSLEWTGRAGARSIKSRFITKRAANSGTHFPLLLPLMRAGPPPCLPFGAQICAPPLLLRPQRKGQQSPWQTSLCSTC